MTRLLVNFMRHQIFVDCGARRWQYLAQLRMNAVSLFRGSRGPFHGNRLLIPQALRQQRRQSRILSSELCIVVVGLCFFSTSSYLRAQYPAPDNFDPGPAGSVNALAVQADGKILIGGAFTNVGGQTRNHLARLNTDGTLDNSFNPDLEGIWPYVESLVLQWDGKILVGGYFTNLAGQSRTNIARLNADGTLDFGFNPGAGRDGRDVRSIAAQPDGKILVGGNFTVLGGQPRSGLGRLSADGEVDLGFDPALGPGDGYTPNISSLVVQADGKILASGAFTRVAGQSRTNIARLNVDGTVDGTFTPWVTGSVVSVAMQADGKILVVGNFTMLSGLSRKRIARLNADGTVDAGFNPAVGRSTDYLPYVSALSVQADGKILVGGRFTLVGGQFRTNIARLNSDGTLDSEFNPGANNTVYALAVQADGKVLVSGGFTSLSGQSTSPAGWLLP